MTYKSILTPEIIARWEKHAQEATEFQYVSSDTESSDDEGYASASRSPSPAPPPRSPRVRKNTHRVDKVPWERRLTYPTRRPITRARGWEYISLHPTRKGYVVSEGIKGLLNDVTITFEEYLRDYVWLQASTMFSEDMLTET
ncbi:MAG: hypothetical protein Q9164_006656 [Protoblastenia rupestris]